MYSDPVNIFVFGYQEHMRPIHFDHGERVNQSRLCYLTEAARLDPKRRRAIFLCDCGKTVVTDLNWVRFGSVSSCGCLKREQRIDQNYKHGQATRATKTGAYRSWAAMHQRVLVNPLYVRRPICTRWCGDKGFENFFADMGPRPHNLTIERIDNTKGYSPSNCTWATMKEQNLNKSNSRK